jgi:hypothetical protein
MPVDHIGSRKTIGAVIIAATTPSEPAAKIVIGVHSAWFWFAKRLRNSALLISTNPFGQPECQR